MQDKMLDEMRHTAFSSSSDTRLPEGMRAEAAEEPDGEETEFVGSEVPFRFVQPIHPIVLTAIRDSMTAAEEKRAGKKDAVHIRRKSRITGAVFYTVLVVIVIAVIFLTNAGGAPRHVFGISVFDVLTGSMQSEIPQGSLVIDRYVDPDTLKAGDDITYLFSVNETITHRIAAIYENYDNTGQRGFQTKGVDNDAPDKSIVPAVNVVGKVIFHIPVLGRVLQWINGNIRILLISAAVIGGLVILLYNLLRWIFKPERHEETEGKAM